MKKSKIIAIALLCIFPILGFTATGLESMQFLKINPDARGASLNDGFVAVSDNVNAIFYNPAGLSSLEYMSASLMHMMYVAETSYEYVSFGMPVTENIKAAVYVVYLNYGSMVKTTETGSGNYLGTDGEFTPYNMALSGGVGIKLSEGLSIGGNIKYAMEDIAGESSGGIMGDAGIKLNLYDFCIGAVVYNIGSAIGGAAAPMMGRAGISTKFTLVSPQDLLVAGGANYVLSNGKIAGSLGLEYTYDNSICARGSYELGKDINAINAGIGIKSNLNELKYGVDYNVSLLGNLGTAHRISLTVMLGVDDNKEKQTKAGRKGGIRTFKIK